MRRRLSWWLVVCTAFIVSKAVQAESWHALAGAESPDHAVQVIAFLPNEMWIHSEDSITWSFPTSEPHSATFLTPGLVRPPFTVGCPGTNTTPDPSAFDNSSCVNSGRMTTVGTTYTVTFPKLGNYRLVCLVHVNMTATIHVLDASVPLPHDQAFYDAEGAKQARALLTDHDGAPRTVSGEWGEANVHSHHHMVTVATGEVVSTPGGINSVTVMRFMRPSITIHAGETVEWDSSDVSGHTVTFGTEPVPDPTPQTPPSANVFADADGARHAILYKTTDSVHSGFIAQAGHERIGIAQAATPTTPLVPPPLPAGPATRFRVTFMNPGVYPYICSFHDQLGMKGEVIVLP